jgi:hypothetical protein
MRVLGQVHMLRHQVGAAQRLVLQRHRELQAEHQALSRAYAEAQLARWQALSPDLPTRLQLQQRLAEQPEPRRLRARAGAGRAAKRDRGRQRWLGCATPRRRPWTSRA